MTDAQKADLAKQKADVFKTDVDAGVLDPAVLKVARENQLIEDGTYPGLESIIDEYGNDEEDDYVDPTPSDSEDLSDLAGSDEAVGDDPLRRAQDTWNGALARRRTKIRRRVIDATPRTLYVYRPVLNADEILAWAKDQGFTSALVPSDLHVTLIYSKSEVDWIKTGEPYDQDDRGRMTIRPGGPRVIEKFGKAVVLVFGSSALSWRHEHFKHAGASSDYEDYNPHITITYKGAPEDLSKIVPYRGEIVLGPEIFQEIKTGFNNEVDVSEVDL